MDCFAVKSMITREIVSKSLRKYLLNIDESKMVFEFVRMQS